MNRLLNRTQWEESNDPTLVRIGLIFMVLLVVEVYSPIQMQQNTTNLYTKPPISQPIFNIFNRQLNHWIRLIESFKITYSSINLNRNWWSRSKIFSKINVI